MVKLMKRYIKYALGLIPPAQYFTCKLRGKPFIKKQCNLCGQEVFRFLPAGNDYEIFKMKKISSGGRRDAQCPVCGSLDRERWVYYVLKKYTNILSGWGPTVLHIAPECNIKKKLEESGCKYYSGDIQVGRAAYVVDLTDIQFREQYFDFIIANHVLEHIPADRKALEEVWRCLKKGGKFICSFPVFLEEKTYENDALTEAKDRIAAFGQEDHCRMYGTDAKERLETVGFKVEGYTPSACISEKECKKWGLFPEECIFVCEK